MSTPAQPVPQAAPSTPKAMYWTGVALTALIVLGLGFSAAMKFSGSDELKKGFEHLGWPLDKAATPGVIELTCVVLYAIPQTSVLGAILLTGYLGGATATHVRIGDDWFGPVIGGVLAWLGLFLRDARLRALLPFKK